MNDGTWRASEANVRKVRMCDECARGMMSDVSLVVLNECVNSGVW